MNAKKIKQNQIFKASKDFLFYGPLRLQRFRKKSFFISYRKAGRTWFANVLAHYIAKAKYGVAESFGFHLSPAKAYPQYFELNRSVVYSHHFYHDGINSKDISPEKHNFEKAPFYNKPTVFLLRDPRDVVVSFFHHKETRNRPKDMGLDEFIRHPDWGIKPIVDFFNVQARYARFDGDAKFFYYEDLKGSDVYDIDVWRKMFEHLLQTGIDETALKWALDANAFEKARKMQNKTGASGRVRKGKVGGYKSEVADDTKAFLDDYINENLDPDFGRYKTS